MMLNSDPMGWSDDEIRYYFDNSWNIQVGQLAGMTGKTTDEIKSILMAEEA